ncbi:MAG: EF-P beta-lysylation protein EpmB [Candidatus Muproteobacteria bacterium RIFCSPHIGHO2_01_FULL_65_16]|uniref:L-lysine 2,3-aminomutase n=1 Tax=Candidatus Muproteobacteria bacterium RIFCSPHIGHO2_01_FULL_65_16 TaxID=1817764 RepID=A0A1F6TM70_9PROT|nr:MAG: EF-P beta-lysylation protein EpmB [Candidatus Muproteobacteria bacterium RIFCSPHIGHO2_01_FULL_65_16]
MIPGTHVLRQMPAWQEELSRAVTDPAELLQILRLGTGLLPAARAAARVFPLRVPRGYIARMRPGDPADPLLRQVLPLGAELEPVAGFGPDPVGDLAAVAARGVLHKYRGRVLLIATGACAVNCRFCFRRHFPYGGAAAATDRWREALAYIAADDSIAEVILSGGDPLMLADRRLGEFARALAAISHVRRLRLHTRLPIVLPERVDDGLLAWLGGTRLQAVVVVHANHANEIDSTVRAALARLRDGGAALLNQSVLLRGVNDSVVALADLSVALFDAGAQPYYLHLLDRVQGAAHFAVDEAAARALMSDLNARLPGYLVPRLVRELPGAPAKVRLV